MRRAAVTKPRRSLQVRDHSRHSSTLDPRALEAVERFVRVLARCGCAPDDIGREVAKACRQIPKSWAPKAMAALREIDDASHVLTLWFSDPAYLDRRGAPLPLPLRGAGGSLETLALRVDPKLDVREVLRYLVRRAALRRVGTRYVPKDRVLSLRGAGGPDNFRHLRGLLGMLRTLEHNGQPKRRVAGWYEVFAENPRFPVSGRAGFDKRLRVLGNKLLYQIDADMHRRERTRKKGERTVRIGVGVYRFEEGSRPRSRARRRRRKAAP
jgi:Family of unknown function (DUF6502)